MKKPASRRTFFAPRILAILALFGGLWINACQTPPAVVLATPTNTPYPTDPRWVLFVYPYMKALRHNDQAAMDKLLSENIKLVPEMVDELIKFSNRIEGMMDVGVPGEEGAFYNSNDYIEAAESMAKSYAALTGDDGPTKKAASERLIDHAKTIYMDAQKSLQDGRGEPKVVRQKVFEALEIFRTLNDNEHEASALGLIGYTYLLDNNKEKAIQYGEQAVQVAEEAGLYGREALILSDLAVFYLVDPPDQEMGYQTMMKALQIAEKSGDEEVIKIVKETYKMVYGQEP